MQGRISAGLAIAVCAGAWCAVPAQGDGTQERRGGNHGCDAEEGTFYSDHFFESGDNISFAFRQTSGGFPPTTQDVLFAENTPSDGGTSSALSCGGAEDAWVHISSNLGPGDDSVRMDAKKIETAPSEDNLVPVPRAISSTVKGGGGLDDIRGHKGFDNIRAGSGADVVKTYDGVADDVNCGTGQDKAVVDRRDDTKNCEDLVVRADPT